MNILRDHLTPKKHLTFLLTYFCVPIGRYAINFYYVVELSASDADVQRAWNR
jgi:hypothetical protein